MEQRKKKKTRRRIIGKDNVDEEENGPDEDNEEDNKLKKKTFRDLKTGTFKEKMMKFKVMSAGSGFCTSLNSRVVKGSDVDRNSVTSWNMREVTILACLYKKSLGQQGATIELMTDTTEPGGTNQKTVVSLTRQVN